MNMKHLLLLGMAVGALSGCVAAYPDNVAYNYNDRDTRWHQGDNERHYRKHNAGNQWTDRSDRNDRDDRWNRNR